MVLSNQHGKLDEWEMVAGWQKKEKYHIRIEHVTF